MDDYSYLGSGKTLIREFGSAAPFVEIGNCSAVTLSPQTNTLTLTDNTNPGGGTRNRVDRVTGVDLSYTFTDLHPDNLARAMRGTTLVLPAGSAVDEAVVGYKGGFVPLANVATAVTSVEATAGGTTYEEGDDYELRDGGLYIPEGSSIVDPVNGAANLSVSYAYGAASKVEALTVTQRNYEVLFLGLNEARSGKAVRLHAHKVSGGVLQELALIGDDFGSYQVTGSLLADTSQPQGVSQYFSTVIVE